MDIVRDRLPQHHLDLGSFFFSSSFLKPNLHFIFFLESHCSSVLKDLALSMGFGGGRGAGPAGLNQGVGVLVLLCLTRVVPES